MLSSLWIFKQIVLYPCNGRLHKNEKEDIINTHSKVENHRCWVISEKARSKNYVLYASWYMTFWKGKNYRVGKKISGYQVFGWREEWIGLAQKILRSLKLFCMILQLCTHIHFVYFSKTIKWVPRVNSNANYWRR